MTTARHQQRRDRALTVITAIVGLAATVFAVAATVYLFTL